MPEKIIAGNWKMNLLFHDATLLSMAIADRADHLKHCSVILFPPLLYAEQVIACCHTSQHIDVGAQNCSQHSSGAFTGEISAAMLNDIGVKYSLVGHSERRQYFSENNELLLQKVEQILSQGLRPVYCCGETLPEREAGDHFAVVEKQLKEGLFQLSAEDFMHCIIAYEPVWAIGTGKTASPAQAQEMHGHIRKLISDKYGNSVASKISILYGGSVTPTNATDIFSCADVDGGLVGGASLKSADFISIINAMEENCEKKLKA